MPLHTQHLIVELPDEAHTASSCRAAPVLQARLLLPVSIVSQHLSPASSSLPSFTMHGAIHLSLPAGYTADAVAETWHLVWDEKHAYGLLQAHATREGTNAARATPSSTSISAGDWSPDEETDEETDADSEELPSDSPVPASRNKELAGAMDSGDGVPQPEHESQRATLPEAHDALAADPVADNPDFGDEDKLCYDLKCDVLSRHFAKPAVYSALGRKRPMAAPLMELDRWSASFGAWE